MEQENSEEAMINFIYGKIESEIKSKGRRVIWIPSRDDETTTLLETWKQLIVKALKRITDGDPFDYVIEIMAQPPKEAGSNYTHAKEQRMIAEKLGILDEEDGALRSLLESRDELDYYQYLDDHLGRPIQQKISPELGRKIYNKLIGKKYLLVFEHLQRPIKQTLLTEKMGLPIPSKYNGCWWLISTLSDDICSESKYATDLVFDPYLEEAPIKYGIHLLRVEAQDILSTIPLISCRDEDKILDCLFYSFMFTARTRLQYLLDGVQEEDDTEEDELDEVQDEDDTEEDDTEEDELDEVQDEYGTKEDELVGVQDEYGTKEDELVGVQNEYGIKEDESDRVQNEYGIKEDELVRFWMEEGFISELTETTSRIINQKQQQEEEDYDYNNSHLFDTGKALMDNFITKSLLHRHLFISPTNAIMSFYARTQLYYHDYMRKWWLWGNSEVPTYRQWEYKKHISLFQLNLNGFPLSPPQCPNLTTLILRGCSHMNNIPDDFFKYMPLLRILDLSYTDLTFIPSSVSCLGDLRLLTLKGCQKLTNLLPCSQPPSSSSSSSSSDSESLPSPEHPLLNLHVLDVSCTNIASLSTTLHMPNLTDFFLDGCTSLLDPPPFLPSLNNLRLLHLTGTQITTFPESTFSCMEWLRVLDLSNNHHLVSLPRSLSKARLLEELHIHSCKALKEINEIGSAKFHTFSISDNDSLTSLPESLSKIAALEKVHIQDCRALKGIDAIGGTKLKILSLSNIAFLTSLPDSLSKMDSLEELHITDCRSLMKIEVVDGANLKIFSLLNNDNLTSSPEWLSRAEKLEKLHLQNCRAMEKINITDNASMRSFFLSGSPIVELSLRGCKNLETIELHDLEELEVLDLSFTRINELPANIFNDLPKLRYFCMVAAQNLRRFPWHQIHHLPKEFIFDHCSCRNGQINIRQRLDGDNKARAHIFVDDPRFFWSLKKKDCRRLIGDDQVRNLLEFQVTIAPCERRCNKKEEDTVLEATSSRCRFIERRNFPYKDIYFKRSELIKGEVELHRPNARLCRHLTMEGVNRLPNGTFWLLDMIESLSISEDRSVVSLSDMGLMNALKECILTQCHNMESVAIAKSNEQQQVLLGILWISGLGKLTKVLSAVPKHCFYSEKFESLKHVHIEHCPRLEKLFPNNEGMLPSLETLTIKFCDSLREITYRGDYEKNHESYHPRLHTLTLLELPKLLYFRGDPEAMLPSLKTLHVRGCWRLRRLPLLGDPWNDLPQVEEISGEQKWWNKLTWDEERGRWRLRRFPLPGDPWNDLPQVVEVSGEQKWWNKLTWDHYCDEHGNFLFKDRFLIRFKPQTKFSSWEPTIRGRIRKKTSKQRLRTTTTIH